MKYGSRRFEFEKNFLQAALRLVIPVLILAGCAHSKNQVSLTPEKKTEAQSIERAQAEDRLTPMEADLQKDALRHNIKF